MTKLAKTCVAALSCTGIAVGCSGGGGKPKIAGNATVHVIDALGKPVSGIAIASSARGTVLAEGLTDATGTATIGVAQVGEITTYKKIPSAYVSRTMFGVTPGASIQMPSGYYIGGPTNVTVTLTSTTDYSAATSIEDYAGYRLACRTPATIGAPATLDVDTTCLQTDGTWTLTAVAYGTSGVLGYAVVPDLPVADPGPVVVHGTADGVVATLDAFVSHVPQPSQPTDTDQYDTAFYFTRKGQGFGSAYGATGTHNYTSFGTPGAHLVEPQLADGLFEYLDVSNQDGDYSIASQTTDLTSITLDALQIVEPPTSVTVVGGAHPAVKVVDPNPQGFDTEIGLIWTDAGTQHDWYGWTAAPAVAGARTIEMPPVPADRAAFRPPSNATYSGVVGYYDQIDGPPDFRTAPDPYVPLAQTGAFTRQFVSKSTP